MKLHRIFFCISLFLIPIQTRILYGADKSYINWYFDYHLAIFLYLSDILLFLCFTSWLLFDPPKYSAIFKNRLFLLICLFIGLVLLSLLHVKHLELGIYEAIKWIEFFLLLLYIWGTTREVLQIRRIATIFYISAIFQAILAWFQFHVQHMVGLKWLGEYISPLGTSGLATIDTSAGKIIRAYGTFSHPNILGAFLVLGIACGLLLVARETKRSFKITILIGLFILSLGLFTTFSRLSWLAGAVAIFSFTIYLFRVKQKNLALLILIPVIASAALVLLLYRGDLQARVSNPNSASIQDRNFFNQLGLDLIKQHPVTGVGVGNYVPALQEPNSLQPWQYQPAHNIFIFIAAELGLVGVGLFILIMFDIFSKIKDTKGGLWPFGLTILGILFVLMGMFDHFLVTIQQGRLMFATVLGLIAALPNLSYEKTN